LTLVIGRTVSHYEILEKLGAGGMGVVYKARDTKLDRLVALKFLPPQAGVTPDQQRGLLNEARAASALDHPNIGVVHDIEETSDGQMFIVMAYYSGEALKDRIARVFGQGETIAGPVARGFAVPDAVNLTMQIATGLAKAHEHGIVHRDIKPGNVMITDEGVAKIIDFGLAKQTDATVTIGPTTKGTAGYMSPEQASGKDVDARSDVWSLGVTLYEMLAGELPFRAAHQAALMHAILTTDPRPLRELRPDVPDDLVRIVTRAMEKDTARRYPSASEMARDLSACQARISTPNAAAAPDLKRAIARPVVLVPAALLVAGLAAFAFVAYRNNAQVRWARQEALPRIAELEAQDKIGAAFQLARQVERVLPGDPALAKIMDIVSTPFSFTTDPPGADVEIRDFVENTAPWTPLGKSPINNARVARTFVRWRVSKPGFATLQGAQAAAGTAIALKLEREGEIPKDMARVGGGAYTVNVGQVGQLPMAVLEPFLVDLYEVTNRQFKEFIDAGGYRKKEFWKHKFVKDGRDLTWEQAMNEFRDSTGRPGPSTWEGGRYPDGQADYPVAGVSWHEAAAYAAFAGKQLPSVYHWFRVADPNTSALVGTVSNFSRTGPAPVGKYHGIGPVGTYDMAGNVKEWCWNETGDGQRFILGGAWNEPQYQFHDADARSPFDRSMQNGFRCIRSLGTADPRALAPVQRLFRDYSKEKPVSDEEFRIFLRLFEYDHTDLKPKIESVDESDPAWIKQKVTIDAAYGNERVPLYLFLPRNAKPPYQTVVYCPGASALRVANSRELFGLRSALDFVIQSGRAVAYPVYKGMYERRGVFERPLTQVERRERTVGIAKDLRRVVDYLETRKEFDAARMAYIGSSFGASHGVVWSTLEERLRTVIYVDGGFFFSKQPPEVDAFNYASRMRRPVLMLSGRYDFTFPLDTSKRYLFQSLGTPAKDKKHVLFDTAHNVTVKRSQFVKEVLDWLDKYLGTVQ
jgi:formylglycine-generating enzyme required for sulfatase activity/dienelactone hydrolase